MAILSQRVDPNVPISRSLGFDPKGVMVDNVTPYWLFFPQAEQYCPPFTVGWSAPFTNHMAGYGYMEIKTPFGQTVQTNIPSNVAQFVNLVWTDDAVSFSPGQSSGTTGSSIDPTTEVSSNVFDVVSLDGSFLTSRTLFQSYQFPAPGDGMRYRFLSLDISIAFLSSVISSTSVEDGISFEFRSPAFPLSRWAQGTINKWSPQYQKVFTNGLNIPVNTDVWLFISPSQFQRIWIEWGVTYQITQV